jgi:hypothetical protein
MRAHALSLTDQQMRLVTQGAKFVPPEVRDYFLRKVSDALGNIKTPTDAQVFVCGSRCADQRARTRVSPASRG